ncbi:hypothetical protein K439DRAFT_1623189 [Ramaria rubella]|nr:hypothetical protein K439DRAFT_1623189 [Ramaria rubella]
MGGGVGGRFEGGGKSCSYKAEGVGASRGWSTGATGGEGLLNGIESGVPCVRFSREEWSDGRVLMVWVEHTHNVHVIDARTFDLAMHTVIPFPDLGYLITSPFYSPASRRHIAFRPDIFTPGQTRHTPRPQPLRTALSQDCRSREPRHRNRQRERAMGVYSAGSQCWQQPRRGCTPDPPTATRTPVPPRTNRDQPFPRIPTDGRASSDRLLVEDREQDLQDDLDLFSSNPSRYQVSLYSLSRKP